MSIFRFKRFEVVNERSAMKVNTDGVLLGALMTVRSEDCRLLDIGTGTGTLALMAAQRLVDARGRSFASTHDDKKSVKKNDNESDVVMSNEVETSSLCIDAIDIDEPSAEEAAANFQNSPWSGILHAHHASLDDFAARTHSSQMPCSTDLYDLIFSNPPYFEDSLTAPDQRKSTARHTSEGLSYRDIFEFASKRLTEKGRVALVLPSDQEAPLCRYARMCGLHMNKITRIRTVPRKAPSRMVIEFSRHRTDAPHDYILTIQNEGQYTQEYLSLMKDFYLFA